MQRLYLILYLVLGMVSMPLFRKVQSFLIANLEAMGGGKTKIIIGKNARIKNCIFLLEEGDNSIILGDNVSIDSSELICKDGSIYIGNGSSLGATQFMVKENTSVRIGEDCMFSYNVKVFSCDGHPYYDRTGQRLNLGKNINIADHVWIGNSVFILKGSNIPSGSIVGAGSIYSLVTFEKSCIYAGNPAKCVKREVYWER